MPTDAQVKTEIQSDPSALGFAALVAAGSDQGIADALNKVRTGAAFKVNREAVSTAKIFTCVDPAEFSSLTQIQLVQLQTILTVGLLDLSDASTKGCLLKVFPAATCPVTVAAIGSLVQRQGSRAEVLWGSGTVISASDVARAMRGQ